MRPRRRMPVFRANQPIALGSQNTPASPAKVRPQSVQRPISGIQPISRTIHRPKYVTGSQIRPVARLLQHRQRQPENRVLRIVVLQRLFQNLGQKRQRGGARVIHRVRQRRGQNLARIQPNQFLTRFFRVAGQHMRHRLQRAAKAPARLGADLAMPFSLPRSRVKNDTIWSASWTGHVRRMSASTTD